MNKALVIFALSLFLLGANVHAAENRGFVPVPIKDKAGNQVGLYKESHALILGVSDYQNREWPPLRGVRADVQAVSDTLRLNGFHVVTVKNPNYRELVSTLNDFIKNYGLDPENRLVFYFAGHGYTHKPSYANDDPEEWSGYFLAADTPDPVSDLGGFKARAMSMQRIEELALAIEAKHALFMFDSCFSGSLFALERAVPHDIEERTTQPVRQFITAGSADETVPDKSIFRRQFVSALEGEGDKNGDGYVTGSELGMFLEETVINLSRRNQTPQYGKIRRRLLNKGDFVFPLEIQKMSDEDILRKRQQVEAMKKKLDAGKEELAKTREQVEEAERLEKEIARLEQENRRIAREQEKERQRLASLKETEPLTYASLEDIHIKSLKKSDYEDLLFEKLLNDLEKLDMPEELPKSKEAEPSDLPEIKLPFR